MKVNLRSKLSQPQSISAFTLIEMIGVLAVIAILAALLIPKVFTAINEARVNSTAVSAQTVKTATADHYGKYGKLNLRFGTNDFANGGMISNYDLSILMPEGMLDKPFAAKIAGGDPSIFSTLQCLPAASANANAGFNLSGPGSGETTNMAYVVQAVIQNVAVQDAKDLNDTIDGPSLGSPLGQADSLGQVEYATPVGGVTTVYLYITGR